MQTIMSEMQQQRAGETDEQTYERAMRDPEVQEIMGDPVMRRESTSGHTDIAVADEFKKSWRTLSRILEL